MKKNQIVFVVILAAIIFVLTFIITIFSIFRLDSFQITSNLYESKLIDSGIVKEVESEIERKFKGRSSIFFGVKEVERTLNALSGNNKNYLIVQKVEKLSPKAVRITIGQRQIDNYCYKANNQFYHFNSYGELLQITDSAKNELLEIDNLIIPESVVKLSTRVQVGQAISGDSAAENEKLNSLKLILQSLDVYFAEQDKQYRTCQYLTGLQYEEVKDNYGVLLQNFTFIVENDWHYAQNNKDGNYEIYFTDALVETADKVTEMYNKLIKLEKGDAHNRLHVAKGANNISWTTK